jgi:hypothetical protein
LADDIEQILWWLPEETEAVVISRGNVPIKELHKMSKAQIKKEIIPNGFKLVDQYDDLPWQHVMFFERDDDWKGPGPKE